MNPEDLMEAEDATLEVYIRMNDEAEKDYCFSVGINQDFESLLPIFNSLNVSLRPSVFQEHMPIGFKVSKDPGYLTPTGGLLFTAKSKMKVYQEKVRLSDKVSDHVWPGQLILPIWKTDYLLKYSIILLLVTWLYTDLPDMISPTPGICFTNQVSRIGSAVALYFGNTKLSQDLLADTAVNQAPTMLQIVFFAFHILKVVFIYFALHIGLINPYSLNPFNKPKDEDIKNNEEKKKHLLEIGWTGSRRATIEEFNDFYRQQEFKKAGGVIKASKLGLIEKLRNPGVLLERGEGFDSDLKNTNTFNDLKSKPYPFVLNYEYLAKVGEYFEAKLNSSNETKQLVKDYRKYGPLDMDDSIKAIIQERKSLAKPPKSS